MIAGHAPLAVALAGWAARSLGIPRREAIAVALVAGGFALVPDVDILHAVVGLLGAAPAEVWDVNEAFWAESRAAHRGVTHSLLLGLPAALGFGLLAGDRRGQLAGGALLVVLFGVALLAAGTLGGAMFALYVLAGGLIVALARSLDVGSPATIGAAAVGLGSHPFGDMFTGTPPVLLYPRGAGAEPERVTLLSEPTLNLLAVFGLELAAVWLGVAVVARLLDRSLAEYVGPEAALGAGYGAVALVLPPPTLEVAAPFAFSVVAVGLVGFVPVVRRVDRETVAGGFVTGLAAVTLGGIGYTVAYLLL